MSSGSVAIGIDLGTTESVVAYITDQGTIEIIPNSEGNRLTPSVFAIAEDSSYIVGKPAIDQEITNPSNTIRSIKRKIGRPKSLVVENKKIAVKIRNNDENLTNNCNNES